MKVKKPQSKRKSTKLSEGIKKKAAAHNRKQKKLAKKDVTWRSKQKKDPGIPNSFPYKDQILSEIERKRREDAELKEKRKQEQRLRAKGLSGPTGLEKEDDDMSMDEGQSNSDRLAALLQSAQQAAREYNGEEQEEDGDDMEEEDDDEIEIEGDALVDLDEETVSKDTSRKTFDKIYKQVVESSDVILYVLDARDPEGTRSIQVEKEVLANSRKRLILIINKIDLVPADVLKKWINRLRLSFPTLPLAASSPAANSKTFNHKGLTQTSTGTALLQALKTYAHSSQLKRSVSVGVIGYPNVGKSSVINALISRHGQNKKACPVGAQAGVTTSIRQVKIDNKLKILDSPGIVFPSDSSNKKSKVDEHSRLVLLNALPPQQIDDPVPAVSLLLKRLYKNPTLKDMLHTTYDLPSLITTSHKDMVTDFLVHVARKKGRLGRGGVPDLQSAAMAVIVDWRDGRIAGWTVPKTLEPGTITDSQKDDTVPVVARNEAVEQKVIVTEWAKEFNLEGLWDANEDSIE